MIIIFLVGQVSGKRQIAADLKRGSSRVYDKARSVSETGRVQSSGTVTKPSLFQIGTEDYLPKSAHARWFGRKMLGNDPCRYFATLLFFHNISKTNMFGRFFSKQSDQNPRTNRNFRDCGFEKK